CQQAIFNLLSNAIQYTPPGGIVSLHATRNNQQIVITVSDTGVGIPPADQARVWGKFERANPQIQQNGVGLGLALVRAFIELHGGTIHLQSAVHQGTTVTCHIPV
ncbi:MAG: ATP-binding protein, partial [Alphaproteobacteria bacterium]|nr:ATP-binding protein [Alphaproteobacteria bacterium]